VTETHIVELIGLGCMLWGFILGGYLGIAYGKILGLRAADEAVKEVFRASKTWT
jgi:hypothetical protein